LTVLRDHIAAGRGVHNLHKPWMYRGPDMKVAVAQFSAGMDKAANLERIIALAERAAGEGAELVVFPEAAMCDFGHATDDLRGLAEPLDGPFVGAMRRLAAHHRLTLVAGMFESIPGDQRIYNTAVVVDPVEGLVGSYRKRHLFDAFGDVESDRIRPGEDEPPLLDIHGFKVSVVTCYDIRFASFIEGVADRGADVLAVPSAWVAGPLKEEQWAVLVRARALDNTMYVAGAGQTGTSYTGRSSIVDPLGVLVAGLGEAEGVATAAISRERLQAVRARLPLLAGRRKRVIADRSSVHGGGD